MDHSHRLATRSTTSTADYAALRRELLRCVRSVCPRWLGDQAEDICQQAMLKVIGAMERETPQSDLPRRYLRRVAFTVTVDEIRKRRVRGHDTCDERGVMLAATDQADPERSALLREMGADMAGCLALLAPKRRQAVALHLQGLARAEIAQTLGCTAKQADNRVYRGLADLRRCLVAKGHRP